MMKRIWRWTRWIGVALGGVAIAVGLTTWLMLRGSLPQLDGTRSLAGLGATVTIERDALGVPTLTGATRLDVARATGFVHAQDRFFQMDLLRRAAAGELSVLFGSPAVGMDRNVRWHRLRARARDALSRLDAAERAVVESYAAGVNAGLAAMHVRPFEYLALRSTPEGWRPEDSLLAAYAMFLDLQNTSGRRERSRAAVRAAFSPELAAFLLENGSAWSARIDGTTSPIIPVPGPEHFQFLAAGLRPEPLALAEEIALGSNNWAVAGPRTVRGEGAIVANDMHLSLRDLPGIWYRARFVVAPSGGERREVSGVTLPGVPLLVVGSNGRVAWGFTNATIDTADLVVVERDPANAERYRTPEGYRDFAHHEETIVVRDGQSESLRVTETIWGPVLPPERGGGAARRFALAWVAHDVTRINFTFLEMENVNDVAAALAIAGASWLPAQNVVAGDREGRIGWTIAGPFPERRGFDGTLPVSWADGSHAWLAADRAPPPPLLLEGEDGLLWTANAQPVGGESALRLGDGGWAVDGRAWQIRERLRAREKFDELALFEIQCDSEVMFLLRWRDLALGLLDGDASAEKPLRREARELLAAWRGAAATDSAGYPLVRQFRREVASRVLGRIFAPCRAMFPEFSPGDVAYEEPLWLLASTQPPWVASREGWRAEMLAAIDAAIAQLQRGSDAPLATQTWGSTNRLDMCHPLARFVPALRSWLGVPRVALPGDSSAPHAFTGRHGPSQRMVVSPGREAAGILHIPGGQSGHPLSRFFRAGHDDWVRQVPSPFLPGETRHTLTLVPPGLSD